MKLKKKEVWTGIHKGVSFEINNWKVEPNTIDLNGRDCWTYYIFIHLDRIPVNNNPESFWLEGKKQRNYIYYGYYNHEILPNIDWHGGITWYSKESGFDGANRVIKVGCDYSHSWDEGQHYDLDIVVNDVRNTIESFKNLVPNYKYWCCGNGKLYDLREGIVKNEQFYSREYWGDKEWFKELELQS